MQDTLSQEQPLVASLSHKIDGDEPLFDELSLADTDEVSPVAVKGRLRMNLEFWQNIGAS